MKSDEYLGNDDLIRSSLMTLANKMTVDEAIEKLPDVLKKQMSQNLCVCNEVIKQDIIKAIVNGATTLAAIKQKTYATMGSGCCKQQVERLLECIVEPEDDVCSD